MKLSKRLMLPMAAIAFVGATTLGVHAVSAADDATSTSLAQKLATKFNLDQAKVQAVIDQHHSERMAAHAAKYEERLDQAVADGQLTATQKADILAERAALKAKLEAAKAQTDTERRATLKAVHQEAIDWAQAHNISPKWLLMGPHGHGHESGHSPDHDYHPQPASPPTE